MMNPIKASVLVIFPILCSTLAPPSRADDRVTHVYDGDTLKVGPYKVRLLGVNTPEMEWKEKGRKRECFALKAKNFVDSLVHEKRVRLEQDPRGDKKDKYNRILAYVYLGDLLINAELIKRGYGFAMTHFPFSKKRDFKRLEQEAQTYKRGLWRECEVTCDRGFCRTH